MHTYIQCQNQQVNRRQINITYLLTAPEHARGWSPERSSTGHFTISDASNLCPKIKA